MSKQILHVWLNQSHVGELTYESASMQFRYNAGAPQAISISMPLQDTPYDHKACFPYFDGLLPDNSETRQLIARRFGANPHNTFSMLKAIGRDCAGAISFHPPGERPSSRSPEKLQYRIIDEQELAQHIRELPQRPLFVGVDGIRLSLAGAQDKAAVCLIDGQIALPLHGTPTTHILKPPIIRFPDTIQNEYLCLRIAHRLGLPAPEVQIRNAEDQPYLIIARYDREITADGFVRRFHQEDLCQALAVPPSSKYQADGGPTAKDCFQLMMKTTVPALNINRLAEFLVFNFLIGNMDAHAKNFSLLHGSPQDISLAPLYDILCTRIYKGLSEKMAMKIGRHYDSKDIFPRHWQALCTEVGFNMRTLCRIIDRFIAELPEAAVLERDQLAVLGYETDVADQIVNFVTKSCALMQRRFSITDAGESS